MPKMKPVPCQHIADYYQIKWLNHQCIGNNLLRLGYAAWAKGGDIKRHNNLYPLPKRRPQTSVKQILVRDFNWRMGNLRRLMMSAHSLDEDLRDKMQDIVRQQMDREQYRHEGRLMSLEAGDLAGALPGDWVYQKAVHEAATNYHDLATLDMKDEG